MSAAREWIPFHSPENEIGDPIADKPISGSAHGSAGSPTIPRSSQIDNGSSLHPFGEILRLGSLQFLSRNVDRQTDAHKEAGKCLPQVFSIRGPQTQPFTAYRCKLAEVVGGRRIDFMKIHDTHTQLNPVLHCVIQQVVSRKISPS
jgi:hypothetical protein